MALGVTPCAIAQPDPQAVSVHALVGPSIASVGHTFSTLGSIEFDLTKYFTLAGEAGILPRASLHDASEVAVPVPSDRGEAQRMNAYHWNGNVKVRPFLIGAMTPYLTAGAGSFTADTVTPSRQVDGVWVQDRRRATDFATNVGAGVAYRVTDWLGVGADYRRFFLHRDRHTPTCSGSPWV